MSEADKAPLERQWIEEKVLDLERSSANKDYGEAVAILIEVLEKNFSHASRDAMPSFSRLSSRDVKHLCSRLCSSALFIFASEEFVLPKVVFTRLISTSATFHMLLAVTSLRDSNHVLKILLSRMQNDISHSDFYKLAFLWSPYCGVRIPWAEYFERFPDEVGSLALEALCQFLYLDADSDSAINELIESISDGKIKISLNEENCFKFAHAWMFLSYRTSPKKRLARRRLNKCIADWLRNSGVDIDQTNPSNYRGLNRKAKPKVLVFVEVMNERHAMYRAIGAYIAELKQRFRVIGVGFEKTTDAVSRNLFDGFVSLDYKFGSLSENIKKISKVSPDIMIFSSIGMSHQGPVLANIRFAPVQIALPGHCDLPESEAIDFFAAHPLAIKLPDDSLQGIMPLFDLSWNDLKSSNSDSVKANLVDDRGCINIAVNCASMKLSADFVKTLSEIEKSTSQLIHFNFFANANPLFSLQLETQLEGKLANYQVHLPADYGRYLKKLAQNSLSLAPFPYSNGNGNIDCAKVGVPVVSLASDPVTGLQDKAILSEINAPKMSFTATRREYVENVTNLVEDQNKLRAFQKDFGLSSLALESVFKKRSNSKFVTAVEDCLKQRTDYKPPFISECL